MSVLRNMGQMFFLISPDASISEYEECNKICVNQLHFLNAYLNVNRTAGKKSKFTEGGDFSCTATFGCFKHECFSFESISANAFYQLFWRIEKMQNDQQTS